MTADHRPGAPAATRIWVVGAIAATLIAALAFRLPNLSSRPMHNDEANQAYRAGVYLLEEGSYRYDPLEHHGPTLYYLTLPLAWVSGGTFASTTETTYRLLPVLFGVGLILLLLLVIDGLGATAVITAGVLTAVSPGLVYYSRFYIQEMLLVFFTFLTLACAWRYVRTHKLVWAILTGVAIGLMHATKETCVIAYVVMAGTLGSLLLAQRGNNAWRSGITRRHAIAGISAAIITSVVLFSSFFSNLRGPLDSLLTYSSYLPKAGEPSPHVHGWTFYLHRLLWFKEGPGPLWTELPIFLLALVGLVAAWLPGRTNGHKGLHRFLALYAVLMTLAYCMIPYKTTWCMLSFLHAWILVAGIGAAALMHGLRKPGYVIAPLLVAAAAYSLGIQARRATSPRHHTSPNNPYVYAHTVRPFLRLVRRIEDINAITPLAKQTDGIIVVSPTEDTWPLPWNLRRFHTGFFREGPDSVPATIHTPPIVISTAEQQEAVFARFGNDYQMEFHNIRPDRLLLLFIRRDLWDTFMETR